MAQSAAFGNSARPPTACTEAHYRFYRGQDLTLAYEPQVRCDRNSCHRTTTDLTVNADTGQCGFISAYAPGNRNHPRDLWNLTLEQRQYLLSQPPLHFPQIPQSTRACTNGGNAVLPIISDPCLWKEAQKYYQETNGPQAVPGLVLATTWPPAQPCSCLPLTNSHAGIPVAYPPRGKGTPLRWPPAVASPAVSGVKFNVQRDSALRLNSFGDVNDIAGADCRTGVFPAQQTGDNIPLARNDTAFLGGREQPAAFQGTCLDPAQVQAQKGCHPFRNVTRQKNLVDQIVVERAPNGLVIDRSLPLAGYNNCTC